MHCFAAGFVDDSRCGCSLSTAAVVVFCWAWPLFAVGAVSGLLSDETQIWPGDLRVVVFWCFLVFVLVFIVLWTLCSLFSPSDENIQLETLGEEFELAENN